MLSGHPHALSVQLDVELPPQPALLEAVGPLARRWLAEASAAWAHDAIEAIEAGPALPQGELSGLVGAFGEAGTPWGSILLLRRRGIVSLRAWSRHAADAFLDSLSWPLDRAEVRFSRLDSRGQRGAGDSLAFGVETIEGRWLELSARWQPQDQDRAAGRARWDEVAREWAAFVEEFVSTSDLPIIFGSVADDEGLGGGTPFEDEFDLEVDDTLGADLLRGYGWITVAGPVTARGLRAAWAGIPESVHRVVDLPSGGLLLQATRELSDYADGGLRSMFQAVALVLPEGEPLPGGHGHQLIYEDASDYQR